MKKIYWMFNRSSSSSAAASSIRSSSMVADAADDCAATTTEAERKDGKIRIQSHAHGGTGGDQEGGGGEGEKRRNIEVRLISAQDLKRSKLERLPGHRMRTYAVAYVDADHKAQTRVDEKGGQANPVWNEVLTISVAEAALRHDSLACLTVDIFSRRPRGGVGGIMGDRLVGTVRIFLSDVVKLDAPPHHDGVQFDVMNPIRCMAFWIRLPSGDPHGILNVWIPPTGRFLRRWQQHNDKNDISASLSPHLLLPPAVHNREDANCSFKQLLQRPAVTASLDYHHNPPPPPHHHHHHHHHHRQILGDSCCEAETESFLFE